MFRLPYDGLTVYKSKSFLSRLEGEGIADHLCHCKSIMLNKKLLKKRIGAFKVWNELHKHPREYPSPAWVYDAGLY